MSSKGRGLQGVGSKVIKTRKRVGNQVGSADTESVEEPGPSQKAKAVKKPKKTTGRENKQQTEGSKEGGSSGNPLEVSVVLRQVFKNLRVKDLLQCSLVNKQWNVEARSIIREQRVCVVQIGQEKAACQQLRSLEQVLKGATVVPFNYLKIYDPWFHRGDKTCISVFNLSKNFEALIKVGWKGIEILGEVQPRRARGDNSIKHKCQAMKLVSGIIKENSGSLEEFRMQVLPPGMAKSFALTADYDEELVFPEMKIAKFGDKFDEFFKYFDGDKEIAREFLSSFAKSSACLKALETHGRPSDVSFIPDPILKAVTSFACAPHEVEQLDSWLPRFEQIKPRLVEVLATNDYNGWGEGFRPGAWQKWSTMVPFFESCVATLEKLKTDMIAAVVMTRAGLPSLPKLRELTLLVDQNCFGVRGDPDIDQPFDEIQARANLSSSSIAVFLSLVAPNMERVKVDTGYVFVNPDHWDTPFWAWLNSEDVKGYFDRKRVMLDLEYPVDGQGAKNMELQCPIELIRYIAGGLPHVKKLHVTGPFVDVGYLSHIHKFWPDLEELIVDHTSDTDRKFRSGFYELLEYHMELDNIQENDFTHDAALCGISDEVASELRKKSVKYLSSYNLRPPRPSLVSFNKLKLLRLKFGEKLNKAELPSKVVGALVFNRLPQVEVHISGPAAVKERFEGLSFLHDNVNFTGIED